jgi:hypothetical protein
MKEKDSMTAENIKPDIRSVPDPEVTQKTIRRKFTAAFKLCILKEAEACTKQGQLGALLRRKGLYYSNLTRWRRQIKKVVKSKDVEIISNVIKGTTYEAILKEQQSKKIDLIVIASHGRTELLSHLIGSVAENVARGAECTVILIKNK